jgi:predicted secreted hydrolase
MTRRAIVLAFLPAFAGDFRLARPGYNYQFPRDHFDHPDFQTEWWYYTGNLRSTAGRRFGFELTFFRHAVTAGSAGSTSWSVRDLFLAHAALSDLDGGNFHFRERVHRAGPGLAGVSFSEGLIWNGNWQVRWEGDTQWLQAVTDKYALRLKLVPRKPPVIHGEKGISRKGAGEGQASHYISFTRLDASGTLELDGERLALEGAAWMDHEFFTNQLAPEQTGWDWFSIQLDNGFDLMLFHLRRKDGSIDPFSHSTVVDAHGAGRHLYSHEFRLVPGETWTSPVTGARYPLNWRILVPSLNLELAATTPLRQQELVSSTGILPSYWEGAMTFRGRMGVQGVTGAGYLEMTGYDRPVRIGQGPAD